MSPVKPRLASTVLVVRDSHLGMEVYVQERVSTMRFAANMTVFPGGGLDARDLPGDVDGDGHDSPPLAWNGPDDNWWAQRLGVEPGIARGLVCAAVRETFEETGTLFAGKCDTGHVLSSTTQYNDARFELESKQLAMSDFLDRENLELRTDLLKPWDNWVTPEDEPIRFDTYFFVAAQPKGQVALGDTSEASSTGWFLPSTLLDAWKFRKIGLMAPTWAQLMSIAEFETVADLLAAAEEREEVLRSIDDGKSNAMVDAYWALERRYQ